ncbi:hypothetical protein Ahy_B03g064022 [Arachis hypogaea]|uniref:Protein FAR1-RELATED SEQUENCE n=1 Tax=Arachis hypogaea TaxID=3818 RepID=A0A444ZYL8_ARAHY|nr:hypothetical protein Ahy_B03g064022 [Arachis hypogaea]
MAFEFDLNTVPMAEGAEEFEQQTDPPDEVVVNQSISENMKNYTSSDEVINQAISDEELESKEEMYFGTLENAHAYYYQYAQNDQAGIRPSKTYQALANAVGGPANLTFTEKDVRNYIIRYLCISRDETDSEELLKHFSRMKELNPNFFFDIDMDENHKLRNVFWADARCRAAWEYFSDVVQHVVRVFHKCNHHGMSTLLGCALLRNEETHNKKKELECDNADLKGIIPCVSISSIEKQLQREYTNCMFRDVQDQFIKKDFVAIPEVAAILRDAMDSARHKLKEHNESEYQAAHDEIYPFFMSFVCF